MESLLPFERHKQVFIHLRGGKSDPKFGCNPNERPISELLKYGIVNLNKPKGPSSHQVADTLRKILGSSRAGHSGTLDPGVTGVLPTAVGRATRITQALLPAGKEYIATMLLHDDIPEEKVRAAIHELIGKISQLPPVRSAVKRVTREREVYYVDVIEILGRQVLIRFGCQGGTYVRKWIHDLGEKLGCGAHMAQLVRTKAGPFKFVDSWTLQDIEDALWYYREENNEKFLRAVIRPPEDGITHLPKIIVFDSAIDSLAHGQDLAIPGITEITDDVAKDDLVAVLSMKGELVCLGTALLDSREIKAREKGYVAKTHKVFMPTGVYPSIKKPA